MYRNLVDVNSFNENFKPMKLIITSHIYLTVIKLYLLKHPSILYESTERRVVAQNFSVNYIRIKLVEQVA